MQVKRKCVKGVEKFAFLLKGKSEWISLRIKRMKYGSQKFWRLPERTVPEVVWNIVHTEHTFSYETRVFAMKMAATTTNRPHTRLYVFTRATQGPPTPAKLLWLAASSFSCASFCANLLCAFYYIFHIFSLFFAVVVDC